MEQNAAFGVADDLIVLVPYMNEPLADLGLVMKLPKRKKRGSRTFRKSREKSCWHRPTKQMVSADFYSMRQQGSYSVIFRSP